mgnify:CR=1 FL=1
MSSYVASDGETKIEGMAGNEELKKSSHPKITENKEGCQRRKRGQEVPDWRQRDGISGEEDWDHMQDGG